MNATPPNESNESRRAAEIARDPEFARLVRAKKVLSGWLSLLIFAAYFGFIGLMAFAPHVLSAKSGAATLGIPIGIGVILFAWILTGIYVRWANGAYDAMVSQVNREEK